MTSDDEARAEPVRENTMVLKQYYLGCLAHASYLIADEETGAAAVVDPQRDIGAYLEDAEKRNLTILYVVLTHFHADFLAGHVELRDRVGAEICLGARGEAEYDHRALEDGDVIALGAVRMETLETPGHSPESISLVVYDGADGGETPRAVLTGDTLFIGDVGRPDLQGALGWTMEQLGAMLYDSLHGKLLGLPDETLIYPAHGAGSLCGKNLSNETVSTMGVQRRYNYALQPMAREEFVRLVTADQPDAPAYFTYDALLNRKERPTLERTMDAKLVPLSLGEVRRMRDEGAQVLDAREPMDYEGAHMVGTVNIGLGGEYATWAGTLLDAHRPIVLIADPGREKEAAVRLGRIGFDNIAGYLEGGMLALDGRPELLRSTGRITAATVAEQLLEEPTRFILDVRTESEWRLKHIEGSRNIPLNRLAQRVSEIPLDREILIHCASGYRSAIAVSVLEKNGITNVADMVGGLAAWEAAGLETTTR